MEGGSVAGVDTELGVSALKTKKGSNQSAVNLSLLWNERRQSASPLSIGASILPGCSGVS